MKSFAEYLIEGGAIKGHNGEESTPISTEHRHEVSKDIVNSLSDLHDSFHNSTGKHLFGSNKKALKTGNAFSGSSKHLFNPEISDEELHKHKPSMGDVDTQVPKEHLAELHKHLQPGLKFGKFTVVGTKKHGNEVSAIVRHHDSGQHHQIDFEGVEYHKDEPTKFEQFAHSSSWEDTKHGIKGSSHKQLLNAVGLDKHKFSITHGLNSREAASGTHGEKDTNKISKTLFGHEHTIDSFDDVANAIRKHIPTRDHEAIIKKFAERGHPVAVHRLKHRLAGNVSEAYEVIQHPDYRAQKAIKKSDGTFVKTNDKVGSSHRGFGIHTSDRKQLPRIKTFDTENDAHKYAKQLGLTEASETTTHASVTLPMGTSNNIDSILFIKIIELK